MKKAVMYGAGNIGRGFIGQLFSESGYEVIFVDVNPDIINKLNSDGKYPVKVLNGENSRKIIVKNVRGVDGSRIWAAAGEIADADIMATAVGVNVLPKIAKPIAEGLKLRWQLGKEEPLNIIICENLLNADHYLAGLIKQELDDVEKIRFDNQVGLVEASIGRMVPVMTPEMQDGNLLTICVEEYQELPVDKDGFKGKIPSIKNMLPASPFAFYIQRKLYIHNMGHALTAYLGRLKEYRFIWEAIGDPQIRNSVLKAMRESAIALSKEHRMEPAPILRHVDDLIQRFGNKELGDTVARVGNDTKRKLSPNDRLVGAANLCLHHGIHPVYICLGIAAAMRFDLDPDSSPDGDTGGITSEVEQLVLSSGAEAVLRDVCGLSEASPLWKEIIRFRGLLDKSTTLPDLMEYAENTRLPMP